MNPIPYRWCISLLILVLLGLLSGCTDTSSPSVMFERALDRIANVTGVEPGPQSFSYAVPPYPRPRDLRLEPVDLRVGFAGLVQLGECRLLGEVTARNSSLGKFQADSSRLLYELRFYRGLTLCLGEQMAKSAPDAGFLRQLREIEAGKRRNLPIAFWNATFASPEFRSLLNTATESLSRDAESSPTEIAEALDAFIRIGQELTSGSLEADASRVEARYQTLGSNRVVGPLLQAMAASLGYLERSSGLLETVARQNRLCPAGRKTPRGKYLHNVFRKFYVGEIQPYLSQVHGTARPIMERLDQLARLQSIEVPPAFREFHAATFATDSPGALWPAFQAGIARHTRAWQSVLGQCQLMPGRPNGDPSPPSPSP